MEGPGCNTTLGRDPVGSGTTSVTLVRSQLQHLKQCRVIADAPQRLSLAGTWSLYHGNGQCLCQVRICLLAGGKSRDKHRVTSI